MYRVGDSHVHESHIPKRCSVLRALHVAATSPPGIFSEQFHCRRTFAVTNLVQHTFVSCEEKLYTAEDSTGELSMHVNFDGTMKCRR